MCGELEAQVEKAERMLGLASEKQIWESAGAQGGRCCVTFRTLPPSRSSLDSVGGIRVTLWDDKCTGSRGV